MSLLPRIPHPWRSRDMAAPPAMMPWPTPPQPPAPTLSFSQCVRWVRGMLPARVEVWDEGEMICCGMGKMVSTIRYGPGLTEKDLTVCLNAVRRDLGLPAPPGRT